MIYRDHQHINKSNTVETLRGCKRFGEPQFLIKADFKDLSEKSIGCGKIA